MCENSLAAADGKKGGMSVSTSLKRSALKEAGGILSGRVKAGDAASAGGPTGLTEQERDMGNSDMHVRNRRDMVVPVPNIVRAAMDPHPPRIVQHNRDVTITHSATALAGNDVLMRRAINSIRALRRNRYKLRDVKLAAKEVVYAEETDRRVQPRVKNFWKSLPDKLPVVAIMSERVQKHFDRCTGNSAPRNVQAKRENRDAIQHHARTARREEISRLSAIGAKFQAEIQGTDEVFEIFERHDYQRFVAQVDALGPGGREAVDSFGGGGNALAGAPDPPAERTRKNRQRNTKKGGKKYSDRVPTKREMQSNLMRGGIHPNPGPPNKWAGKKAQSKKASPKNSKPVPVSSDDELPALIAIPPSDVVAGAPAVSRVSTATTPRSTVTSEELPTD